MTREELIEATLSSIAKKLFKSKKPSATFKKSLQNADKKITTRHELGGGKKNSVLGRAERHVRLAKDMKKAWPKK